MAGLALKTADAQMVSSLSYRILLALQGDDIEEAAALARENKAIAPSNPRLAQLSMMAFQRANDHESAGALVAELLKAPRLEPEIALHVAQHLLAEGRSGEALRVAEAAIRGARKPLPRLNLLAAQATLDEGGEPSEAIAYLEAVKTQIGRDAHFQRVYGELLLEAGRFDEACEILGQAAKVAPNLANVQRLYARALKMAKRYEEASEALLKSVEIDPSPTARRLATAALLQAGREEEATQVYHALIAERKARLRPSFQEEVESLRSRAKTVKIPQARLDWAWDVTTRALGHPPSADRADWELRAKWGHLMDAALIDWLECSIERSDEINTLFDGIDEVTPALVEAQALGRGVLLASAHIGLMFAGPLAVHSLGKPYRWLSSTPRITTTRYADTLISTSDLTETQVARRVIDALREGCTVILAVDGAMSPNAPRVEFEGAAVTYSDFTAAMSYRLKIPSFFVTVYWQDGKIRFVAERLPDANQGETMPEYAARWRKAYFDQIRAQFCRGPENLRLNGGIWRDL